MDFNQVTLIGRLTREPELRTTSTGQSIAQFSLATSHRYKGANDVQNEEKLFIDISAWGAVGENVAKYCKKGDPIFLTGRLKLEQWDDKETGQKRSKISVVAGQIQFLKTKSKGTDSPSESVFLPQFGEPPF